ncbi:MAG: molybdopterin cofactor-binding domain-containing protein, partial [Ruthenibacterium sp.]
ASTLKMNEDGTMQLLMCNHDMGHGCLGVQQQIVAEVLGLNPSDVTVSYGDTFLNGWNNGESASRGVFVKGGAALQIASLMKELLLGYGAQYFAIPAEQLEICVGGVAVKGAAEKTVSYAQLVEYVHANHQKDLMISDTYASHAQPGSYGAHFVDLQIDKETGEVEILN